MRPLFLALALVACGTSEVPAAADASEETASDAPCLDSCVLEGRCTEQADGTCVAGSAEDCRRSNACIYAGQCAASGGVCVATSEDDCTGSVNCEKFGLCSFAAGACAAANDDDCRSSFWCISEGHCSATNGTCAVVTDGDCQRSDLCKEYGECLAHPDGYCVKPGA